MKAKLVFDLPDDQEDHLMAIKGKDYFFTLWDLDQELRSKIKHQNQEHLQEARDLLHEVMSWHNIDFEEVE